MYNLKSKKTVHYTSSKVFYVFHLTWYSTALLRSQGLGDEVIRISAFSMFYFNES